MEFINKPQDQPIKKQQKMYSQKNKSGTLRRFQKKVNRNEPCICGSGVKFKKCCGK